MANLTLSEGEVLYTKLQDTYSGDLSAATFWELRAAMAKLHWNHRHRQALELAYWDKAWARWQGKENEPAPVEL